MKEVKIAYITSNLVVGGRFYAPRHLPNGHRGIILETLEEIEAFKRAFPKVNLYDLEFEPASIEENVAEKRHLLDKIEELEELLKDKEEEIAELEDALRKLAVPPSAQELEEALDFIKKKDEDELKALIEGYEKKYDIEAPKTKSVVKLWLVWLYITENRLADRDS